MRSQSQNPLTDPSLAALAALPSDERVVFLHSGRLDLRWANASYLAQPTVWFRHFQNGDSELIDTKTGLQHKESRILTHRAFEDLRAILNNNAFQGKWFGHISYETGRIIESAKLAPLPGPRPRKLSAKGAPDYGKGEVNFKKGADLRTGANWPLIELGFCPQPERFDVVSDDSAAYKESEKKQTDTSRAGLIPNMSRQSYEQMVEKGLTYIGAGDVFQVNLAQCFTKDTNQTARELFLKLTRNSPAWYGALIELPNLPKDVGRTSGGRALVSTSPELFLHVKDGLVTTRPIKGTRSASADSDELAKSEKDAAELNMIVDLMRNDLGRVCAYGSVRVDEARAIESHPTVHHGVGTITGRLHESKDIVDLLKATLPGGSVTGAPKVRAMQIIDELEPTSRGPYCGCIGYLSKDEANLSIAIRTMTVSENETGAAKRNAVSFHVGAGIVADSQPAAEYDETLDKAQAMITALSEEPQDSSHPPTAVVTTTATHPLPQRN